MHTFIITSFNNDTLCLSFQEVPLFIVLRFSWIFKPPFLFDRDPEHIEIMAPKAVCHHCKLHKQSYRYVFFKRLTRAATR